MNLLSALAGAPLAALAFGPLSAQTVNDQTAELKLLRAGKYLAYNVEQADSGDGYVFQRINSSPEVLEVNPEKNFPEHSYIEFDNGSSSATTFLPDDMAFPITLAHVAYKGNEKLQKQVGYVPREIRPGTTNRVVVLGGVIYDLSFKFDPERPETFVPYRLYVHESFADEPAAAATTDDAKPAKKLSLKERMRNFKAELEAPTADAVGTKLNDLNAIAHLEDYLAQAYAQQQQVAAAWNAKPANSTRLRLVEERRGLMDEAMKKYNEDLMDTPEWRRIQENNRLADEAARASNVTLKNDTGRDIYIYEDGSHNGSRINVGSSGTYSCNKAYYYTFDGNSNWREGKAVGAAGCGTTVAVK